MNTENIAESFQPALFRFLSICGAHINIGRFEFSRPYREFQPVILDCFGDAHSASLKHKLKANVSIIFNCNQGNIQLQLKLVLHENSSCIYVPKNRNMASLGLHLQSTTLEFS